MLKCRGTVLTTPPEIANHVSLYLGIFSAIFEKLTFFLILQFNMDGKSFFVEQLAIQKTEIKVVLLFDCFWFGLDQVGFTCYIILAQIENGSR